MMVKTRLSLLGPALAFCVSNSCGFVPRTTTGSLTRNRQLFSSSSSLSASSTMASNNLSPLFDTSGATVTDPNFAHKRVALYFAAGWCPMCTSFEPSLQKFKEKAEASAPIDLIYVPSDRSASDAVARAAQLGMMSVPFGEAADAFKTKYRIWAGSESAKLGTNRRSGVPALVVLDKQGAELAFVAAEAQGPKALETWPLEDVNGIWGE